MNLFDTAPPLYLENARICDPIIGETRGALRLARGRIAGINVPAQRGDLHFNLDGALVLPGLVNAHDHLELNNFPKLKFRSYYTNAREWSLEMTPRLETDPVILAARQVRLEDRLFLGGVKNLLAGTTTVAHHNPFYPSLRGNFPVRVLARYGWSHSLYLSPDFGESYRRTPRAVPWFIHLAEGTNEEARGEFTRLVAGGALRDNTVLVHGVGLTEADRACALERGAALVWCPSSNFFLLNAMADVHEFAHAHRLALGSDSRLTGERDLLDEARIARETSQISDAERLRAITCDAANILRLNDVGRIAPGARADLVIMPKEFASGTDAVGRIRRAELRAVIFNGRVRIADPDFAPLLPNHVRVRLDGQPKIAAHDLAERYARSAIQEAGFELEA